MDTETVSETVRREEVDIHDSTNQLRDTALTDRDRTDRGL